MVARAATHQHQRLAILSLASQDSQYVIVFDMFED